MVKNVAPNSVESPEQVYKIERPIGNGSYGEVHLAKTAKGKQVAVKRLVKSRKNYSQNDVEREVDAYQKFNHKNVVKFVEYFDTEEAAFIVLEYIEGTDLCSLYESRDLEPLPEPEIKKLFKQLIDAVAYIHLKGVVHLDLKLENVLLDKQNRVKLIDFGFCDILSAKDAQSKRYVGSKEYTSPEILMKKPYNGFKADVWSLGVMLYVLFFADFPFDHREFIETIVTRREIPAITFPYPISKDAESLIRSMLVLDPNARVSMKDIVTHKWFEVKKQGRRFSLN